MDALARVLGSRCEVVTATSGAEGLATIAAHREFAVVICDMRMPNMDGSQFLARVKEESPNSVRMLLTGHAEIESAIEAINHGGIFRFLTKPCSGADLKEAVSLAVRQYQLVEAEKVLLEQTLPRQHTRPYRGAHPREPDGVRPRNARAALRQRAGPQGPW